MTTQLTDSNGRARCPELQLLAAVLEDALKIVSRRPDVRRGRAWRDFLDARQWFLESNADWPFSFVNVCELLGIDPHAVRQRLRPIMESNSRPAPEIAPEPMQTAAPEAEATLSVRSLDWEEIERDRFRLVMWDEA